MPGTACLSGWTSASSWTETSSSLVILACCPSSWTLVPGYSHWWNADCMTTLPVGQEAWYTPTTATQSRVVTTMASVIPARRNFFAAIGNMDATSTTQLEAEPTSLPATGSAASGSSSAASTASSQYQSTLSRAQIIGLSVGLAILALCMIAASIGLFWRRKARQRKTALYTPESKFDNTQNRWDKSELPVRGAERFELHDDSWDPRELPVTERRGEMVGEGLSEPVELPGGGR